jgi:predicted nucleic acid-binding protein
VIVADTNLLVYDSIEMIQSRLAKQWRQEEPVWCVPSLWQFEFTNAIMSNVRAGKIEQEAGVAIIIKAIAMYSVNEYGVDQIDVYRVALRYRISTYDANYVVLAEMLGTVCVTGDQQMLERVPHLTRPLSSVVS